MNFMVDDEFLLLMSINPDLDVPGYNTQILTIDERKKLRDVGIQTVLEYLNWEQINPSLNQYNFEEISNILYRNREANMKIICPITNWNFPAWMPDEWFAKHQSGEIDRSVLSIWHEDAQSVADEYYQNLINYFGANDVLFIWGDWQGGEGIYPAGSCFYDDAALNDYKQVYGTSAYPDINTQETLDWYGKKIIEHSLKKQQIFYPQCNEIWNMQQFLMDTWTKGFGNFVIPETFQAFRNKYPDDSIVFLQYTYFDDAHYKIPNEEFVDNIKNTYNSEVIVEAHFAQGLRETTPKAIAKGFRGQICSLLHAQAGYFAFEDWMLEEVKKSNDLWREARINENNNNS